MKLKRPVSLCEKNECKNKGRKKNYDTLSDSQASLTLTYYTG